MTRLHGRPGARRRSSASLLCGLALAVAGCGDSTGPANPPSITLATSTVMFAGAQGSGGPAPQTIAVSAGKGERVLTGLGVGTIAYGGGGGTGWLNATLDKPIAPATLTLTAATGALPVGTYTATVPVASAGATNSPQQVAVTLLVLGSSGTTSLAAAGQSVVFLNTPNLGTELELAAGAQYLIAVVNTGQSPAATEDFTLAGVRLTAPSASVAVLPEAAGAPLPPVRFTPASAPAGVTYTLRSAPGSSAAMRRLAQNHLAALDWNRQTYARLGNPRTVRARLQSAGRRLAPLAAAVSPTVGTVNQVYVRNQLGGDCTTVDSIGARTVALGQHVIVLADTDLTAWPDAQRPDSAFYQTFADEYDQITWPHIQTYVGDPLAFDASLSSIGKVTVTITPKLNTLGGGIVAFVNPCDFFPFASSGPDADFSNNTEMFYSLTPAANGFGVTDWEKELRATASHETKHLVAIADRIINNSPTLDEIWLEEGLAQESSEIWMRHFNIATWKGHANFAATVACEFDFGAGAPCDIQDDKPLDLAIGHFQFLFAYLLKESQANSEGLGVDFDSDYGAGWAFARWATDQYATDEGTFIKSLVNEPALTGLANLSSHTGQPVPLLLVYWNLASAIFTTTTYAAADPRITIPSFSFGNIFNVGQTQLTCGGVPCGLFTQSGTPAYPVQPFALSPGPITQTVHGVPGTAAAFFLLTAPAGGTEALQLESGSGGPLASSSGLRVGIIRVN
jgi:hypothetical protein